MRKTAITTVLFFSLILLNSTVSAQDVISFGYEPDEEVKRELQFLYTNKPVRKGMFKEMNDMERQIVQKHFQYLSMLREKGILILAGPNLDETFGIVVFFAESEEEAKKIMDNDPANSEEIMESELHPFRVSLMYDFTKVKE